MNREKISESLKRNGIPFEEDLPEKLEIYLRLLQEWNLRMDLTAVEEEADMVDRHFMDSLTVLRTDLVFPAASMKACRKQKSGIRPSITSGTGRIPCCIICWKSVFTRIRLSS